LQRLRSQGGFLFDFFRAIALVGVLLLGLLGPSNSEEYRWSGPVSKAVLAPTDSVGSDVTGASLQGGLVDLRYGQASVDVGGLGVILEWTEATVFTLNGAPCRAAALTSLIEEGSGLTVAVRYDPSTGLMGWCDAVSSGSVPAVGVALEPWKAILTSNESLTVKISPSESKRLGLKNPTLFIPGMVHGLDFRSHRLGWQTTVPIKSGWNWKELPLFVTNGNGLVFRGQKISVSTTGPSIGESGPRVASEHLTSIPGWFQLEGNLMFLDLTSIRLSVSNGARITRILPRRGRVDFTMEVVGSGTYRIEASIADLVGRETRKTWSFSVRR
jgi:hypothetical protein